MKQILQKISFLFSIIFLLSFGKMNAQCATINGGTASLSSTPGFYTVSANVCLNAPFITESYLMDANVGTSSTGGMNTIVASSSFAPFDAMVFDPLTSVTAFCTITPQVDLMTGGITLNSALKTNPLAPFGGMIIPSVDVPPSFCVDVTFITSANPFSNATTINFNSTSSGVCTSNPFFMQFSLPIILNEFEAKSNHYFNTLTWKTSHAENFSHFEIEKSNDSKNFKSIGKVNLQSESMYSFNDNNINTKENFYRLKMVDIDGKFEYSKVVTVTNNISNEIIIVNNPIKEGNEINIISTSTYEIFTIDGSKVNNIHSLKSGLYFVKNKEGKTAKFIVE